MGNRGNHGSRFSRYHEVKCWENNVNRAVIETVLRAARKHNVALFRHNDNFSREEKISAIALEIESSVNDASEASWGSRDFPL